MRTIFLYLSILIGINGWSQRNCGSTDYLAAELSRDQSLNSGIQAVENFIQSKALLRNNQSENNIIRIPVVVHIIYSTPENNISDEQVESQIKALNRDFRKLNSDTSRIPSYFKNFAADAGIEFVLAKVDPKGRATKGITRKQTSETYFRVDDRMKFAATGGVDAWDSRSYLNIWVADMRSILGYSSSPGSPVEKDGVVINVKAFGTVNVSGAFNLGRTATHEVGHWLGLKHIWGDTYCGDDMVDDTPRQGGFTSGCPSGTRISCTSSSTGDMYMNYMDYTNDACMNLFTHGQRSRMRTLFDQGGIRSSLLASKALGDPWLDEAPPVEAPPAVTAPQLNFFPNPATSNITIESSWEWIGKTIIIINANGIMERSFVISRKKQQISLDGLRPGLYFLHANDGSKKLSMRFIKL
jgi:hypothetical protein